MSYVTVIVALRLRCVEAEMIEIPDLSQHAYDEDVDVPSRWSVYKFLASKLLRTYDRLGERRSRDRQAMRVGCLRHRRGGLALILELERVGIGDSMR